MFFVHDGLDVSDLLSHRPLHSHSGGQQRALAGLVSRESLDGRHGGSNFFGNPCGTSTDGSGSLGAFHAAQPGDVLPGQILLLGLGVDHRAGQVAERRSGSHAFSVRYSGDAPVEAAFTVVDLLNQGGNVPVAHGHHGNIAVGESRGIMQAGGLQVREAHAGAGVFQILIQLVEVEQVVIVSVCQGVHAVAHRPVRHGGQPGVIVGSVDALVLVGQLLGQLGVLIPGHVVGGQFHAGSVKQILVVEQHPEVAAERNGVLHAVHRVVLLGSDESGHVIAGGVQRGCEALGLPVDQVVDFLDHEHVAGVSAFQHGRGLHSVVLGSNVHILDGHAGMGFFKSILLGVQIGGGGGVPGHHGQHLVFSQGGYRQQ